MAGFWKATGRDKAVHDKSRLIGMRKTLVFYKGRAPNGQKSDWIMHEYRLETDENAPPQARSLAPLSDLPYTMHTYILLLTQTRKRLYIFSLYFYAPKIKTGYNGYI
jgi:hypothetical protein